MLYSPLEQFSILVLYPFVLYGFDFSITNVNIIFLVVVTEFVIISFFGLKNIKLLNSTTFHTFLEFLYEFVKSSMSQQTGRKNIPYTPLALTIFLFILMFNFCGIFAIAPTITSQLVVTASLAFSVNLGFFLLAINIQGFKFIKFFIPSGIPILLVPFMMVIEIFSYSIRSISLFVRLFANMMAGHTLMHIISSFFLLVYLTFNYYMAAIPFFLLSAVYILELAIAFLQAYVFLTLFCIYLNDAVSASHL